MMMPKSTRWSAVSAAISVQVEPEAPLQVTDRSAGRRLRHAHGRRGRRHRPMLLHGPQQLQFAWRDHIDSSMK
jgi:hypothetical protein